MGHAVPLARGRMAVKSAVLASVRSGADGRSPARVRAVLRREAWRGHVPGRSGDLPARAASQVDDGSSRPFRAGEVTAQVAGAQVVGAGQPPQVGARALPAPGRGRIGRGPRVACIAAGDTAFFGCRPVPRGAGGFAAWSTSTVFSSFRVISRCRPGSPRSRRRGSGGQAAHHPAGAPVQVRSSPASVPRGAVQPQGVFERGDQARPFGGVRGTGPRIRVNRP